MQSASPSVAISTTGSSHAVNTVEMSDATGYSVAYASVGYPESAAKLSVSTDPLPLS